MPKNQTNINIGVKYNVDQSSVNAVKKSLQGLQSIKVKDFSGTKTQLDLIKTTARQVLEALDAAFNVNLNSLNISTFNQQLKNAGLTVDQIYQSFSGAGAQGQVAFSKMASSVLTTNLQLKLTKSLITSMGETMANTVKWGIASSVMNSFTNSVQQAFQYAKSLDGALTDIRIVTGDSTEQMRQFAKLANNAAQNLGRSTMDYTKAALTFYQQGLSDEEVQTRTETVLKAQNITGAGLEMADYLTAVWNGYKVANLEAELYVDKLAAVADSSASNMSLLAVAMSKVASSANALGVPVDNLNAQIATIVATTRQAPESVGNALKTIYSRINDITTGADDAEVSLGNYSKQMASIGFSVLDANGNLRDTGDVLDEIGGKWLTLSREQQIYLARTMAGQRQYNNLIALFDNWSKYTDLVNVSLDAQGTTMLKNARYMDSLEAKMEQFGAASERVKDALINEESLKGLISTGTTLVNLVGNFVEAIGGGGNALLLLGSSLTSLFSGVISKEINNLIINLQNVKNNALKIKLDILNTKLFGQSQGYRDGTITAMVDAKKAAQLYYGFMTDAQKNEYNEIVKQIGVLKDKLTILNEQIQAANKFESALRKNLDVVVDQKDALQDTLSNFSGLKGLDKLKDQDQLNLLKERINGIRDSVDISAVPALKEFYEALNNVDLKSSKVNLQLRAVRVAAEKVASQTNIGIDLVLSLDLTLVKAKEAASALELAKRASEEYLLKVKQFANINGIVQSVSAIGQMASAFRSLENIKNIIDNKTLSTSLKFLQVLMSIGMALPIIVTSFNKLKTITASWSVALGVGTKVQTANLALTKAQEVATKKHAVVQQLLLAIEKVKNTEYADEAQKKSILTGLTGQLIIARQAETAAIEKEAVAQTALNHAMLANPIGLGLLAGAVAIAAAVKIYDALTVSTELANQAALEAKQKYDDVKSSFDELKSSIENYNNAQNAIKDLTKGTQEWRDAIKESNDQVLLLLDKYPLLAAYVKSVNGQLQVSKLGFDELINSQTESLRQAQAESIKTSDEARQKNIKETAANIASNSAYQMQEYDGTSMGYVNALQVLAVALALNNLGDLAEGEQTLADAIVDQTGLSIQVVEAILQNKDSLISLGNQIDSNTLASRLMYEQVAKENLGENEQYQGLSDELQSITEALVAKKLAEAESALEVKVVLDSLNESIREATELFNKLQNALPENNREAMEKFLTGQSLTELSKLLLQNLNPYDLQTRKFFDENYALAGYDDGYAFQQAFIAAQQEALAESEQIISGTVDNVRDHFNKIKNLAISIDYTLTVVKDLEKAFIKGGLAGLASLTSFYDKVEDTSKLDEVAQRFDFANGTAEELGQALALAGAATNLTTELLNSYILAKQQEASAIASEDNYKTIHDIINGLKTGDTITGLQAEQLERAGISLDGFFTHMADGTLKLRGDAEDFFNYANTQSLDGFRKLIESLGSQIGQQTRFDKLSTYSASNGGSFEEFSSSAATATSDQNLLLQLQINFLQAIGVENVHISEAIQKITKGEEVTADLMDAISKLVEQHSSEWENLSGIIDQNVERIGILHELLQNASEAIPQLDSDVDLEKWQDLTDYIELYGEQIEGVDKHVKLHREAAEELAEAMLRYDHALEEVADHYKDWLKALTSGSLQEQVEVGNLLQNVYADLLDLPFESLSPDFTQNILNLHLLQEAANGSEAAYNQLMLAAQQDIESQVHITLDDLDFWNAKNLVQTALDDMNFQDILIGANLDTGNFLQSLTELVNAAGMTADQATDYLSSMGIDAKVTEHSNDTTETQEIIGSDPVENNGYIPYDYTFLNGNQVEHVTGNMMVPGYYYRPRYLTVTGTKQNKAFSLLVESAHKKSGGGFKFNNASHGGGSKAPKSSGKGGGKGGGGKGSTKKPTIVKPQQLSEAKSSITDRSDVYHDVNLALKEQEDKLDDIENKLKKLVNRDRLKNLQEQNKELEKQKDLLDLKSGIAASELVRLRNELIGDLGNSIQFDPDGAIANYNAALDKARDNYNDSIADYNRKVANAEKAYNNYVANYNSMSALAQEKNKTLLDRQKDLMDQIKKLAQRALDVEKEKYDAIKSNVKEYLDTLDLQKDIADQQQEIILKMYENLIAMSKIKVDLSLDTGEFERDWLEFENKFIKKLSDDDFLGSAKANIKELMSYFNSDQVQLTAKQIEKIRDEIAIMERGGTSAIYGDNLAQAKEDLELYMKQQMEDLENIQDLVDDIKDNYLDALDDAKLKMDDQIDQYERVNDLIEHNVKLVDLLYGDKAYDTMNKYYDLQKANNERELQSLKMQQDYWQNLMNNETVGSEAWKEMKKNLDDVTDNLNSKLEDMILNLSDQWLNRIDGIIAKLNNALSGGRGLDYLDLQWDYINNFDDNFLDTFESRMGIQEVTDLYKLAIDGLSGSPSNQQKINKLMNDQLKILREKDNLTQYDIDRAKAALEVEKARMALEEARYNKTKMRLRRDSQGNYTYQYVADELKLSELQSALADAQANLYNMDKEHYTENLNNLYDAYKDYLDKMRDLTEEYNNTQDEEERARIQSRINLLKESANDLMGGLTEDNRYALQYLNNSFFGGMGIDTALMSADLQMELMMQNIPQVNSNIQDLANNIVGLGGLLNATHAALDLINQATVKYDLDVKQFLTDAGSSLEIISEVTTAANTALDSNIVNAQNLITTNDELIKSCEAQVAAIQELMSWLDLYMNKVMNVETLVANLRSAYNTGQLLNGSNLTADNISVTGMNLDTTAGNNFTGNPAVDAAAVKQQIDALMAEYEKFLAQMAIATFDTGGSTGSWGDASGRLAFLHEKELVLNQEDTLNILRAVQTVRAITSAFGNVADSGLSALANGANGFLAGINNTEQLDQNVHIEANFPNVTQHTEIEQAFENLVNMASMKASKYRD